MFIYKIELGNALCEGYFLIKHNEKYGRKKFCAIIEDALEYIKEEKCKNFEVKTFETAYSFLEDVLVEKFGFSKVKIEGTFFRLSYTLV